MWAKREVYIPMLFLLVLVAAGVPGDDAKCQPDQLHGIDPSMKLPPEILINGSQAL